MTEIIRKMALSREILSHEKHPDDKIPKITFLQKYRVQKSRNKKNPEQRGIFERGQIRTLKKSYTEANV